MLHILAEVQPQLGLPSGIDCPLPFIDCPLPFFIIFFYTLTSIPKAKNLLKKRSTDDIGSPILKFAFPILSFKTLKVCNIN